MKKLSYAILVGLLLSQISLAETWTFDTSKKTGTGWYTVKLSESFGNAETDGWWKDSSGTSMRGQGFIDGDNIILKNNLGSDQRLDFVMDKAQTNLGNLSVGGTSWTFLYAGTFGNALNLDSITNLGLAQIYQFDLHVSGNVNTGGNSLALGRGNNSGQANYRVRIDGNVTGGNTLFVMANGLIKARSAAERTFENGMANPDTVIKGIADGTNVLMMADPNYDSYIQIGGLSGQSSVSRESKWTTATGTKTYVILANTSDYSSSAAVFDWEPNSRCYKTQMGTTSYTMNGPASQSFTSTQLGFMGGVKAIQGTIKMNFKQDVSFYSYYADNSTSVKKVVKFYSDSAATKLTTFSHGDLEMLGGVFASTDGDSYGSFRFTNIKYTSGKIQLRLDAENKVDSIDLTSYYQQIDSETPTLVAGGTISREGASKITFNLVGNLNWLIDDGFGEFDINGGKGAKIISWDSINPSLSADDFAANTYVSGEAYDAFFTLTDDGLYVKYIQAVPEPAVVAAFLGALALAFASWRRNIRLG